MVGDDSYELILLKNGKKVFEAILLAEMKSNSHISYDEASFAILDVDEEHKKGIRSLIELFLHLWDELEEEI